MIVMQRTLHPFGIAPGPCRLFLLSHVPAVSLGSSHGQQSQFKPGLRCIFAMYFPVKVMMPVHHQDCHQPLLHLLLGLRVRSCSAEGIVPMSLPKCNSSPGTSQLPIPDLRGTSETLELQCCSLTALGSFIFTWTRPCVSHTQPCLRQALVPDL